MKRLITSAALALALAGPAAAECYADYKPKRAEPLQLHYGVAQVSCASFMVSPFNVDECCG